MGVLSTFGLKNKILKCLDHINVVKYEFSFIKKGKFYIGMEYADAGDLGSYLKNRIKQK
jgi:serine/threonine protein kinase